MQQHEQGNHGWSVVHESMALLAGSGSAPAVDRLLESVRGARPRMSTSHLITLIGIALRTVAARDPRAEALFSPELPPADRAKLLSETLDSHRDRITAVLTGRSNSFTGARRFLIPQLLLGSWAAHHGVDGVRLLDVGTGIGLLLRQLNNRAVYDRFAPDLRWNPGPPPYRTIPLLERHGIDAPPLPTLDWVRACHGPSAYYDERFSEVLWSLEQTASVDGSLRISALDMLDLEALTGYLRAHRINVVTCNFVLYQYDEATRAQVIAAITRALAPPGLLLGMEPRDGLRRMGARVEAHPTGGAGPLHVADLSDAHVLGRATAGPGFTELTGLDGRVR
ncbi:MULTISPECIES: DUF2332 family protein [unclassified Streptomyces]|uniref:DUF2332 family protein n=1 Tax=unclassified Streptomyces TaxID=2593676 RepID=UPI00224DD346|nr:MULTISPECIES: DUF2332 family protein [unclassified Streptomyces]MCX4528804.1 DUF2332 domain-containing protein [Streptomyces sp. NBC_01551]MCX4540588.1 DUF2332 domain-containing protein [Streptomyces sp. NBC_01565]